MLASCVGACKAQVGGEAGSSPCDGSGLSGSVSNSVFSSFSGFSVLYGFLVFKFSSTFLSWLWAPEKRGPRDLPAGPGTSLFSGPI